MIVLSPAIETEMDSNTVVSVLGSWGYPALFFLLILTGIGSPIPEDLLLLTAGYLIFSEVFQWPLALGISAAGVVISDLMLYSAGRHLAWHSNYGSESGFLSKKRLQRVTHWFARYGHFLIFMARLLPGTRALVFMAAGIHAVPVWSFLRFDVLGAALWVPAMVAAGHTAGSHIGDPRDVVVWFNRGATWTVPVAAFVLIICFWLGREESKL